jgi:hypothetical protein
LTPKHRVIPACEGKATTVPKRRGQQPFANQLVQKRGLEAVSDVFFSHE